MSKSKDWSRNQDNVSEWGDMSAYGLLKCNLFSPRYG